MLDARDTERIQDHQNDIKLYWVSRADVHKFLTQIS
jgi:hypothetical protein